MDGRGPDIWVIFHWFSQAKSWEMDWKWSSWGTMLAPLNYHIFKEWASLWSKICVPKFQNAPLSLASHKNSGGDEEVQFILKMTIFGKQTAPKAGRSWQHDSFMKHRSWNSCEYLHENLRELSEVAGKFFNSGHNTWEIRGTCVCLLGLCIFWERETNNDTWCRKGRSRVPNLCSLFKEDILEISRKIT